MEELCPAEDANESEDEGSHMQGRPSREGDAMGESDGIPGGAPSHASA